MNILKRLWIVKYIIEIILCFCLQSAPGIIPEIFFSKPILLIPAAVVPAMLVQPEKAAVIGAVCGVMMDLSTGPVIGPIGILCSFVCIAISFIFKSYVRISPVTFLISAFVSVAVITGADFLFNFVMNGYNDPAVFFLHHYISKIVYTWVFFPLFYLINRMIFIRNGDSYAEQ